MWLIQHLLPTYFLYISLITFLWRSYKRIFSIISNEYIKKLMLGTILWDVYQQKMLAFISTNFEKLSCCRFLPIPKPLCSPRWEWAGMSSTPLGRLIMTPSVSKTSREAGSLCCWSAPGWASAVLGLNCNRSSLYRLSNKIILLRFFIICRQAFGQPDMTILLLDHPMVNLSDQHNLLQF